MCGDILGPQDGQKFSQIQLHILCYFNPTCGFDCLHIELRIENQCEIMHIVDMALISVPLVHSFKFQFLLREMGDCNIDF